ncbi:diaminopimelate decarboxylase [Herbaspirillum rubrisubalbicans]|uniref:Diaminopimelate decarboxylase n=2 Tax=Herbaspirillum rubrisubalbicans TaxID=80842 RepID=A0ABX9BUT2_9BURK|nr:MULTISPECIES: diaminopimelate decarboxylase [Herbaspirillum]NQE50557.1 diaminopimelate decarboxylase [Herbaspirillum rubrisubalbicans]QJP98898.1 diaminopimelate decarboxylase [Herbaspirillum rubrisubalbicans Os34]RAM61525.1 diaminopimelate decarboxylase [Herbaspirillum rubrisubalbicans]RAN42781.1 diaminopimelate decarboxylase [Herbaspirillum rubrisubalbicans]
MSHFSYRNGALHAEQVSLQALAEQFGTPLYVYSKAALVESFSAYANACRTAGRADGAKGGALVCYSVKSNSNLAVLNLLGKLGSGFDIVSAGELLRVVAAGGDARKVIFSGVGKGRDEMKLALEHDILCFNVESIPEVARLNEVAGALGKRARISLRVNPNVDAKTHPYISTGLKENKFGVAYEDALNCYRTAAALPHIEVVGIDCHIGSQLLDDSPLLEALDKIIDMVDALEAEGIPIHHLDIGGGIGIRYDDEQPVAIDHYLARVFARVDAWRAKKYDGRPIQVMFEPGRSVVGNAGLLLTEVQYLKHGEEKNFAVVDAAMNDLMRPAMYEAWHGVQTVKENAGQPRIYDVVGPVCESGDWLARARELAIEEGDLLALMSAGAYGMTMASNYNTRGRAAEVLVDGQQAHLVRARENPADLFALEKIVD